MALTMREKNNSWLTERVPFKVCFKTKALNRKSLSLSTKQTVPCKYQIYLFLIDTSNHIKILVHFQITIIKAKLTLKIGKLSLTREHPPRSEERVFQLNKLL